MSQSEKVRERLQTLDERLARLRAQKNRLLARASQTERKLDTRRKILIGGALLAAIDHGGVPMLRSKADLLRWLDTRLTRPHDRAVFNFALQEPIALDGQHRPLTTKIPAARNDAAITEVNRQNQIPPSIPKSC